MKTTESLLYDYLLKQESSKWLLGINNDKN